MLHHQTVSNSGGSTASARTGGIAATPAGRSLPPGPAALLHLQRLVGNQVVSRLVQRQSDDGGDLSGGGAQQLDTKPCPAGSTTINPVNTTYDVSGATLNELYQKYWSGGKESGSVTPVFNPKIPTYCPDEQGVPIKTAVVKIDETKNMPKWTELDAQCDPVKTAWNKFYTALDTHEEGHVAIDKKNFTDMHKKFVGTTDADSVLNGITTKADTENNTYDTTTDHGKKQGVNIDAGVTCPKKTSDLDEGTDSGNRLASNAPSEPALSSDGASGPEDPTETGSA